MIWGLLAMMSFNAADTWFVAQLGTDALAAMSFTFPVVMVLTSLGIGLMAGTSSVLARVIGEGRGADARRLTTDAVVLALLVSLALAAAGIATHDPLFRLLGASEAVLPLVRDYMIIWYAGLPLLLVPMAGLGAIRATGDTRVQSRTLIGASLANLVLDPLLIFGLAGFPRMELAGAAVATVAARTVMLGVGAWVIGVRLRMLSAEPPSAAALVRSWRRVLHVGLPAAGTNVIIPVSAGIIIAMLAGFGEHAVAGFGAAMRIEALTLVVFYAMSAVIGPFVGQNLGAGKPARIGEAIRWSAVFCAGLGLVIALALWLLAPALGALFSDEAGVVAVCADYLRLVPVSYGAAGLVMVVNAAFNGEGRPLPAVIVSLLRTLVIYVPLAWAASRSLGVGGIFAAACFSNLVCGIIAYAWHQRRFRTG